MLYARFNIKKDYQINNNLTLKIIRFHADGVMANANPPRRWFVFTKIIFYFSPLKFTDDNTVFFSKRKVSLLKSLPKSHSI